MTMKSDFMMRVEPWEDKDSAPRQMPSARPTFQCAQCQASPVKDYTTMPNDVNTATSSNPRLELVYGDAYHLPVGINVHGNIDEFLIKKWHTGLQTPCRCRLISPQAIIHVKGLYLHQSSHQILLIAG